jgi:uncharacterized protein HemY
MKICLAVFLCLLLSPVQNVLAKSAGENWNEAQNYVRNGQKDFAFLELNAMVREYPNDSRTPAASFALAEYYFEQLDYMEARKILEEILAKPSKSVTDLLAQIYLLKIAEATKSDTEKNEREERLKEILSSKRFFMLFGKKATKKWSSPLGNRFKFAEAVDKMEIFRNDELYYTINLS